VYSSAKAGLLPSPWAMGKPYAMAPWRSLIQVKKGAKAGRSKKRGPP
jgi:hypothetical protein